jgi:hypothetical protein
MCLKLQFIWFLPSSVADLKRPNYERKWRVAWGLSPQDDGKVLDAGLVCATPAFDGEGAFWELLVPDVKEDLKLAVHATSSTGDFS